MRDLFVNTHLSSVYRGEESIKARHIFSWICWLVAPIGRTPIKDIAKSMPITIICQFVYCISVNCDIKSDRVITSIYNDVKDKVSLYDFTPKGVAHPK